MAPLIPTVEPTEIRAGSTWLWDRSFADYPSTDGWVLTYVLAGPAKINLAASLMASLGTGWRVTVPATTTASFKQGAYEFLAILTGSGTYAGRIDTIPLPLIEVLPNLATAAAGDRVPHAKKMLDLVRTAIAARIAGDEPEFYAIDGSSAKPISLDRLLVLETRYAGMVARLNRPQRFGTRVQYRITPVSQ